MTPLTPRGSYLISAIGRWCGKPEKEETSFLTFDLTGLLKCRTLPPPCIDYSFDCDNGFAFQPHIGVARCNRQSDEIGVTTIIIATLRLPSSCPLKSSLSPRLVSYSAPKSYYGSIDLCNCHNPGEIAEASSEPSPCPAQ